MIIFKPKSMLHYTLIITISGLLIWGLVLTLICLETEQDNQFLPTKESKITKKLDDQQKVLLTFKTKIYTLLSASTEFHQLHKQTIIPDICLLFGLTYQGRIPWLGIFNRFT